MEDVQESTVLLICRVTIFGSGMDPLRLITETPLSDRRCSQLPAEVFVSLITD